MLKHLVATTSNLHNIYVKLHLLHQL